MALIERTGNFGRYYGNTYDTSSPLNQSQMELNAVYIYNSLSSNGWSLNAICGMLGNMQTESSINPGRWQSDRVGGDPTGHGYGLVQWTPYTKYTEWATNNGYSDPSTMDCNLARINYEVENNLQWIPTYQYPMTFEAFKTSNEDPYTLAMIFLANYERPADPYQPARGQQANAWYEYLSGVVPTPGSRKKSHYKFVLFNRRRTRYGQRNIFK